MKIEKIRIENFRCFKDEEIYLDDYTCFIGANGSGKSTILYALNVFFRHDKGSPTDVVKLTADDFHHRNTDRPVRITVTFNALSPQAIRDFAAYARHGKLVVSSIAEYDEGLQYAEVKQCGYRMVVKRFAEFFKAEKDGKKVADLRDIYNSIREEYAELPKVTTKNDMIKALREYEGAHPELCELVQSEDYFYGVSRGVNRLEKHIQWAYIPGVQDIVEEGIETKGSVLGLLLERTVRSKVNFDPQLEELKNRIIEEYQAILDAEQAVLEGITDSISRSLKVWAHPAATAEVNWKQDPDKAIKIEKPSALVELGERGFSSGLARFGHGLQRSFLFALILELSIVNDENQPTLIMGIEEPELYQHPPQTRHLAEVLGNLAKQNSQIVVCSHSPLFIPGDNVEAIRVVREQGNPSYSSVHWIQYKDLNEMLKESGQKDARETGIVAKLYPTLNPSINEMFFCKTLILVEGIEDSTYIYTSLLLNKRLENFRKLGCHVVPVNGKSMLTKPIAMAKLLDIPVFVVFDSDTDKTKCSEKIRHRKDNESIQRLLNEDAPDPWPAETKWGHNYVMWNTNMTSIIEQDLGSAWQEHMQKAYEKYGNAGGLQKSPLAITYALELAWNEGLKSPNLEKLITRILEFAEGYSAEKSTNYYVDEASSAVDE